MKPALPAAKSSPTVSALPSARTKVSASPPPSPIPHPPSAPVLLAVIGMSPAVLTETIWALAHEPEPVIPSRIIVVTTAAARRQLEARLLQPLPRFDGRTAWETLRECLVAEGHRLAGCLAFGSTASDIRVITATDSATGLSRELEDLRTPADNEAAADFLLEQVRSIVENPDTQLIASIAGGRKTMGALLYACLTLAGREHDRLTHVLVSEPFESVPDFFFPAQPGAFLSQPANRTPALATRPPQAAQNDAETASVNPRSAIVELADVPFVALRNLFQRDLGRKAGTFSRLVQTCRESVRRRAAEGLRLTLDSTRPGIEVNGTTVKLAPVEHVLILFLAHRAKHREPAYATYKEAESDLNAFRTNLLSQADPNQFADWRGGDNLRNPLDEEAIRKAVSSIRGKLRGRPGDAPLLAACLPEKGRCSLDLEPAMIYLK